VARASNGFVYVAKNLRASFLGYCFLRAEMAPDGWGSILFLRGRPSLFFTDMLPAVATAFLIVPTRTRPLVRRSAFCYFLARGIKKRVPSP
jgi:hypothetical protein